MLFNTFEFWLFFVPVLILVHILSHRGQNIVLLVASYVFYGAWDWRFLSLILISTIVDYFAAPLAAPGRSRLTRRAALAVSVAVNLGILGFFKYYNFFAESFATLFGLDDGVTNVLLLNVILPVGISFYTFQTMSYTLDVYAGKMKPVKYFPDFALYVAFFPQLVAGPIERGSRLIPQIVNKRKIDPGRMESACHLIAWGLFKKVFIADTLAHPVTTVFASTSSTGAEVYVATICFAIQIYCDFSGYSDIARGLARLMGFDLMLNFNLPYIARNPVEFWRRWHISLSTWLRDYLYIPLGGNRFGNSRTCMNLMTTMLLGGLWHGARFNFVLWGAYHGIVLVIYRFVFRRRSDQARPCSRLGTVLSVFFTFHVVLFGWLLFRVENTSQLTAKVTSLFCSWGSWSSALAIIKYASPMVIVLIIVEMWQCRTGDLEIINKSPWPARALFFGLCISVVLLLNRSSGSPFIYFQF